MPRSEASLRADCLRILLLRQDRARDRRAEGDQIKDSADAGFESQENASEKAGAKDSQTMKGGKCEKYY